jgi:glutathione S-transferase
MNLGLRIDIQDIPEALANDIARIEEIWQEGLGGCGAPFLASPAFSAVDAFFAPVAWRFLTYGVALSEMSAGYAKRLRTLEPMQAWYAAALAEPWREAKYDEASLAAGRLIEDLRTSA